MRTPQRSARLGAVLPSLVTVCLIAGCSGGSPAAHPSRTAVGKSAPSSSAAPSPMPGAAEAEIAPVDASFPASLGDDRGPARPGSTADARGEMTITGLRLTPHNGYDRLVIDLSTQGVPDWSAQYGPIGGGDPIAGDAFLHVSVLTDAAPAVQTSTLSATGGTVVAEARSSGVSPGYEEVIIGVRGAAAPFRAFTLTDPGRIVVDIRAPG